MEPVGGAWVASDFSNGTMGGRATDDRAGIPSSASVRAGMASFYPAMPADGVGQFHSFDRGIERFSRMIGIAAFVAVVVALVLFLVKFA